MWSFLLNPKILKFAFGAIIIVAVLGGLWYTYSSLRAERDELYANLAQMRVNQEIILEANAENVQAYKNLEATLNNVTESLTEFEKANARNNKRIHRAFMGITNATKEQDGPAAPVLIEAIEAIKILEGHLQ